MTEVEDSSGTLDTRKKNSMSDILMKRGKEGWELFSIVKEGPVKRYMSFKRPLLASTRATA